MKTLLKYLAAFLVGVLLTQIPDLISLYADHTIGKYQKMVCNDKGIGPDKCDFFQYFPLYEAAHPTLNKIHGYLLMGEGPLYFVLSSRCSNGIFYNINASPNGSGKMTKRNYFFSRCSHLMNDISDIIFQDASKEQEPSIDDVEGNH